MTLSALTPRTVFKLSSITSGPSPSSTPPVPRFAVYCAVLLALVMLLAAPSSLTYAHSFGGGTGDNEEPEDKDDDDDDDDDCPSTSAEGGNVILFNGKERHKEVDMVVKGNFPIVLQRKYDNQSDFDSSLGYGWAFNHDYRLYEYADDSVVIRYCTGTRAKFVYTGGSYVGESTGMRGSLIENGDGTYEFNYISGRKDFYDAEGRLTAQQDRLQNRLEFTYSDQRMPIVGTSLYSVDPTKPMTVAHSFQLQKIEERLADGSLSGNSVSFSYDSNTGRLTQIVDHNGRTVSYAHDELIDGEENTLTSGNLLQVQGLEGVVSTYKYEDNNDNHNLTYYQIGVNATPFEQTYDSDDRVIKEVYGNFTLDFNYLFDRLETQVTKTITDADGLNPYTATTRYVFDENGRTVEFEDEAGYLTLNVRDSNSNTSREERYGEKDANGQRELVRAIDYTYDFDGHRVGKIVHLDLEGDNPSTHETTWTYTKNWIASEQIVSSSASSEVFRTEYEFNYDSNGTPINIAAKKQLKADATYQTLLYSYNDRNQMTAITYPDGVKRILEYEDGSQYPTHVFWMAPDEIPHSTSEAYYTYDVNGNLFRSADGMGNTTTFLYDQRNRLIQATNPLLEEAHYTYESLNLVKIETGRTVDNSGQVPLVVEGRVTTLVYDGKNRITTVSRQDDNKIDQLFQNFTYDSRGQRLSIANALGQTVTTTYDLLKRIDSISDAEGSVTKYTYDVLGNQIQLTDALGRVTQSTYDELDRIIERVQLGEGLALLSKFDYDALGNLIYFTDPEGNISTFQYDRLGRKIMEQRPGGQVFSLEYDNRNRLSKKIGARGQVIRYSYEDWGGLISIEQFASVIGEDTNNISRTQSFAYDENGNLFQSSDSAIQTGALYSYSYDALNRLSQTQYHYIPGGDRSLSYSYSALGNRESLSFNDDGSVTDSSYEYDSYSRLIGAILEGNSYAFSYDSADRPADFSLASVTGSNSYNIDGTLASTTLTDGNSILLESLVYNYDLVNNISSLSDNDGTQNFDYDDVDRLTLANYSLGSNLADEEFHYDGVGNREDPNDVTVYEYNANNQLVSQNNGSLIRAYDDDGNLITISGTENKSLEYDWSNRLIAVSDGSTDVSYGYDPKGRRLFKTVGGITTWFLWDDYQLVAEFIQNGNNAALVKRYDYLPNAYSPSQVTDANGTYSVFNDHLETPRLLVDDGGQVVWRSVRTAFGETSTNEDYDANGTSISFNVRFPGQYFDGESGLHYNNFRDYDPSLGRYIQSDPIGLWGGANIYLYSLANPLTNYDRAGLYCLPWFDDVGAWQATGPKTPYGPYTVASTSGVGIGSCIWKSPYTQTEARLVTPQEICYDCECGDCEIEINPKDSHTETRENYGEDVASTSQSISGNTGCCMNPWTREVDCSPVSPRI